MKRSISFILAMFFVFFTVGCRKNPDKTASDTENLGSGVINVETDDTQSDGKENTGSEKNNTKNESDAKDSSDKNNSDKKDSGNSKNDTSSDKSDSDKNNNDLNNPNSDGDANDAEYKKIKCKAVSNWKKAELVVNSNKFYVSLNIPSDWEINTSGSILIEGQPIGTVKTKSPESSKESFKDGNDRSEGNVIIKRTVEKYTDNGKNRYERHFKISQAFDSGLINLYITVNYNHLDDSASEKLYESISYLGTERTMPEMKNSSKKIIVLGNSFLSNSYSRIGLFLNDMLASDGQGFEAEVMSVGMANVSTFAQNAELISRIEKGEFVYVFQCGFYSNEDSFGTALNDGPLKTIIDACEKSNTGLILFPAHNEPSAVINNALSKYQNLYCINWKNEIDSLINSGIGDNAPTNLSRSDFCLDDNYSHSTPLAGYVGAHMIYRNIFGKAPFDLTSNAPLAMTEINSKLINYPKTGIVPGTVKAVKYYV